MYSHFDSNNWVTPFGLIFVTAMLVVWALARRNAAASHIDGSHVDLVFPIALIVGIAGGTIVAVFMPMDHMVAGKLMNHGIRLRLFGMLASAAVAVFVYSRVARISFRQMLDLFAIPTLVGLMIHRTGCFLAGCCWGDVATPVVAGDFTSQVSTVPFLNHLFEGVRYRPGSLPFEQHVALGLIPPDAIASLPVVPVQLYEAALLLLMVLALWRFKSRNYPQGTIAVLVTCAYALMRFFVEYMRADGHIIVGNLTVTQLQCLVLLCSAMLLPGMLSRPGKKPVG